MKIGIYGGSFNPIHFGHIGLAQWVIEHTDLDELWLMVSPNNPLKDKNILADEQDRLLEAKEAIEQLGDKGIGIVVSDFEFALPRPTYTANTLRELQKQYPEHDFTLIIGEDNLEIFDKWREYQYILDNYRISGTVKNYLYRIMEHGDARISPIQKGILIKEGLKPSFIEKMEGKYHG